MIVGVKFCGHCNPRLDLWQLFEALQQELPYAVFHFYIHDPNPDILLLLNGCPVACCSRPPFPGPTVTVSPGEIDHQPVGEVSLLQALVHKLSTQG